MVPAAPTTTQASGVLLIVDDEPYIRAALRRLLRLKGWEVCLATNGLEAVEQFQALAGRVLLVLLDILAKPFLPEGVLLLLEGVCPPAEVSLVP